MDIWIYSTSPSFSNATLARPMETPRKLNIVQNSPSFIANIDQNSKSVLSNSSFLVKFLLKPIPGQSSNFIPSENTRKSKVF